MVKVTVDLVRKKAEHHDKQLAPLREISLHQEGIEKIEHLQQWCPKLQILLLQSNLIPKIENLNKLKELEYLNLALNNIERIENLERCESLNKLDLTLNFIGDLTSVESLQKNYNLKSLFLCGNPCADFIGYRDYVIGSLPQLEILDGEHIKKSERILALQKLPSLMDGIIKQQENYIKKRKEQRARLEKQYETCEEINDNDEESVKRFWNEKSEHAPETRTEIEKRNQAKKNAAQEKSTSEVKKERKLFGPNGRPYNINELKLDFNFDDSNENYYALELHTYKYLDSSLISVDVEPFYVRVTVKQKIFQLSLPEEINTQKSTAKRSQTTGALLITLLKIRTKYEEIHYISNKNKMENKPTAQLHKSDQREYLEIGCSKDILDLTKLAIRDDAIRRNPNSNCASNFLKEKLPPPGFKDDLNVPPLI